MKRVFISVLAALALLSALAPLTAWQNTPTLGVLPDSGPALPATCVVGQIYFKTTATAGLNQCTPANTWTALTTTAGSGTVNAGTTGQIAFYPGNAAAVSGATGVTTDGASVFTITDTAANTDLNAKNTTAAVVGLSQGSPKLNLCGRAFHGSADVEDCLTLSELPGNGNDAAITVTLGHTGTSTGPVSLAPAANGSGIGTAIARWSGLFTSINMSGTMTGLNIASGSTIATTTNCAGVGTAANPSVVSCTSAITGSFSCATNASTGTCQVNTTAVTANSEIFVTQRTDTTTGTRLSVTCNTTVSTVLPVITAVSAGTSFTINLGTVTTNPECFSFFIVN